MELNIIGESCRQRCLPQPLLTSSFPVCRVNEPAPPGQSLTKAKRHYLISRPCLRRYTWVTGREPLTYYDMNLSAQDHQTFFTCDSDHLRPADASKPAPPAVSSPPLDAAALISGLFCSVAVMQKAWRERNPQARISAAHEALELEE